jgi:hypothetical protein
MLKTIAMINCDICGRTFEHLAVCADKDPMIWHEVTSDLEQAAEGAGWSFYHEEHRCAHCLVDAFYKQEQQKMQPLAVNQMPLSS